MCKSWRSNFQLLVKQALVIAIRLELLTLSVASRNVNIMNAESVTLPFIYVISALLHMTINKIQILTDTVLKTGFFNIYIYIYIYIYMCIYIYIYMCVCVCVCVCKASFTIVISFLKDPCVESTYTFLTFLLTLLSFEPWLYPSTVHSTWHLPLREQLVLLVQLHLEGSVCWLFLSFLMLLLLIKLITSGMISK